MISFRQDFKLSQLMTALSVTARNNKLRQSQLLKADELVSILKSDSSIVFFSLQTYHIDSKISLKEIFFRISVIKLIKALNQASIFIA